KDTILISNELLVGDTAQYSRFKKKKRVSIFVSYRLATVATKSHPGFYLGLLWICTTVKPKFGRKI
ncbi:hypothetical protein ACJX0J_035632, partial [Zea mays]